MIFQEIKLTPKIAYVVNMLYMSSADGIIEQEEITYLLTILHGDLKLIRIAEKYMKQSEKKGLNFNDFLEESSKILSLEQKETILINLIDMMYSDNELELHEEKLLKYILKKYDIDENKLDLYKNVIAKKNNYSIFK